ncbi:flagellin [Dyella sp. KRB-257]|uniref:flagellin N-terminal helical domain-containing protein n=1 Tax=Dyella sp. KRB-257 TaxID=3400915 RepID=UPI003C10D938
MSFVINTNVSSLNAQNNLATSKSALAQATQRLSSGLKINSAADNAAGFAISQRYTTQVGGLAQASANASDAINLAQTTGSALDQVTANLQAIRDLAVQSANGTYSSADRATIDQEVQQRLAEVTRIASQTTFNGQKVLDGSLKSQNFQIGADVGQTISVSLGTSVKASDLGKVAEVSTGDISAAVTGGYTLPGDATNGLTVQIGSGSVVNVAGGNYKNASDLAAAINTAAGSAITTVDSTSGELTFTNTSSSNAITFGGAAATTLGIPTTVAAETTPGTPVTGSSTLVKAAVTAAPKIQTTGLVINGAAIDTSKVASLQDLADAINAKTSDSGASASVNSLGTGLNVVSDKTLTIVDGAGAALNGATDLNTGNGYASNGIASVGGSLSTASVKSVDAANDIISRVDTALTTVAGFAAQLGAVQNRFQSTISTLSSQSTNLKASQSTIQDADFAAETAALSRAQVLQQAGISVLAQANSQPQQVLKLLQ